LPKQQSQKPGSTASPAKPGFFRYLGAIFYDLILVIAVFFVATAILLPFNQGEAIHSSFLFPLYLLSVSFVFYGWFWTHGGQTLGLRAWKLRLLDEKGELPLPRKERGTAIPNPLKLIGVPS
jgi:uncharacterized RDD family membrane protein YckC